MKEIIHSEKKDVFSTWLNDYCARKNLKYIWPQICYRWDTGALLHIVFEKNSTNEQHVQWPMHIPAIPATNIDFTTSPPTLGNGKAWDYQTWHERALACMLSNRPEEAPASFWDWRLKTKPQGNATCDLDFFCKTVDGEYIGIEATEIYYVDPSPDPNRDVYEHLQRLLTLRKGENPGFNLKQLKAQMNFVRRFQGRLFMLFHQILKRRHPYRLRDDKCLLLEINDESYEAIEFIVSQAGTLSHEAVRDPHAKPACEGSIQRLKRNIHFVPLCRILDRFVPPAPTGAARANPNDPSSG